MMAGHDLSDCVAHRHQRGLGNDAAGAGAERCGLSRLDCRRGTRHSVDHGLGDILDGIGRLPHGRRRDSLAERFLDLLADLFENRIVDWTVADARACARIMEDKRRRGEPLDSHVPDAFLAAAAASRGLAVVTRNTSEFRNTGVTTVNPWTAVPAEPQ